MVFIKYKLQERLCNTETFFTIHLKFNKLSLLPSCGVAGRANCRRGRRIQIRGRQESRVLYSINHSTLSAFPRHNFSSMAHCGESLDGLYSCLVRLPDEYLFDLSFSQFMVRRETVDPSTFSVHHLTLFITKKFKNVIKRMAVLNQYSVHVAAASYKHSHVLYLQKSITDGCFWP